MNRDTVNQAYTGREARQIVAQLNRSDDRERAAAQQAIREMGPRELSALLALLGVRRSGAVSLRRTAAFALLVSFVFGLAIAVTHYAGTPIPPADPTGRPLPLSSFPTLGDSLFQGATIALGCGLAGTVLALLAIVVYRRCARWRARSNGRSVLPAARKRAAAAISRIGDRRCVGILIDVLECDQAYDSNMHAAVRAALTRLLPGLRAEDDARLTHARQETLRRALRTDVTTAGDAAFKIAIFDVFAHHGEASETLRDVERLAGLPVATDLQRDVSDAARECAAALRRRIDTECSSQTLLRPSDGNTLDMPEVLRRAASALPETDPRQLLRAAIDDSPA